MASEIQTNTAERRRWNDEYWASVWPKREQLTRAVTDILLGQLVLVEGERVLDVGSGGGTTAITAARLVGDGGSVVGADISAPLVDLARKRAVDQRAANVSFCVADVQHDSIPGGPFDVVVSQFGVMFFDEPATAFANIHRQLVASGRIAFACWQSVEKNPWFVGPALTGYLPPPPAPSAGKSPTGPFSLSDPDRVAEILDAAGWKTVQHTSHELVVSVEREAIVDDGQLTFLGVPEQSFEEARRGVEEHLERISGGDGRIDAALAFQIFTARS
ncbi:MAG: class I SAM-dependent methyltransferase [Solirubrobacteraceae bacterium]